MTITTSSPGAAIHFTVDGSTPRSSSPLYTAPFSLPGSGTVQAIAIAGNGTSGISIATFTVASTPAQARFTGQPSTVTVAQAMTPNVTVEVDDSTGSPVLTPVQVVLSLVQAQGSAGGLSGTLQQITSNGIASFTDLSVNAPGAGFQFQATIGGVSPAVSNAFTVLPAGASATFAPPAANPCGSNYDKFYSTEPGVYAYWPLCEDTSVPMFYDYVGRYDWNTSSGSWFSAGTDFTSTSAGPVKDGEGAAQVATASSFYAGQNMVLNSNAGTIAIWAKTSADQWLNSMLAFEAVGAKSKVWLGARSNAQSLCFQGQWVNTAGTAFITTPACGYTPNTWHRVSFSWANGQLQIYVDGVPAGAGTYTGTLDNKTFVYRLFPEGINNGKQMTLAKAAVSNQAWSAAQAAADFAAALPSVPAGGVLVTSQVLGTVHRDVLGMVDNQAVLTAAPMAALVKGLGAAGVTSVRYANGSSGIQADQTNWQAGTTGNLCGTAAGSTVPPLNAGSLDTTDTYVPGVGQALGLSLGYTVNYGTNPPLCNAGGDPTVNGANLVRYLNKTKGYGFKYFEIGNELYNGGGSETDMHPHPGDGASYGSYESAFATSMKAVDPSIKIGIPVGLDHIFNWVNNWTLPAMATANYDAAIFHSYPTLDPVTDGATLYPERIASNQGPSKGDLLTLQTMLLNVGKSPESIWVTEWNDNANGGGMWSRQTLGAASPLFAAMWLGEYMNAGVQWATWFAQYGQTNYCNPYNYDSQAESAYSAIDWCSGSFLVYTGALPGEGQVGFKADDLSPVGQVFALLSQSGYATEGEHALRTVIDDASVPWLLSYAATHGSGVAVILINRDRDAAHTVPVQLATKASGSTVQQWTYGRPQYDTAFRGVWSTGPVKSTAGAWSGTFNATLPPWSISVFVF